MIPLDMLIFSRRFFLVLLLITIFLVQACDSDENPGSTTGATFKIVGTKLTDPCGETIVLKGVNKMSVFDEDDLYGDLYFPEIAKTNSNCVRIVWQAQYSNGSPSLLNQLDSLIKNFEIKKLILYIEIYLN